MGTFGVHSGFLVCQMTSRSVLGLATDTSTRLQLDSSESPSLTESGSPEICSGALLPVVTLFNP